MIDKSVSGFDNFPCEVDHPTPWPFSSEWADKIRDSAEWEVLERQCGSKYVADEILSFLTWDGVRVLEKVVSQNQIVRRIKTGQADFMDLGPKSVDWQNGNTWERNLDQIDLIKNAYAISSVTGKVKDAFEYVEQCILKWSKHSELLIRYIESQKEIIRAAREEELALFAAKRDAKRWGAIEEKHSAVRDGFIYVAKNDLMPGVFKVGFTTSNPDKRVSEISKQYNLPTFFALVKYWRSKDPYIVEQRIHESLSQYKKGGEFFEVPFDELQTIVETHVIPY
jgi:hypothetical protein